MIELEINYWGEPLLYSPSNMDWKEFFYWDKDSSQKDYLFVFYFILIFSLFLTEFWSSESSSSESENSVSVSNEYKFYISLWYWGL